MAIKVKSKELQALVIWQTWGDGMERMLSPYP